MQKTMKRARLSIGALALLCIAMLSGRTCGRCLCQAHQFSIAPQSVSAALLQFSNQSGVQVATATADISKLNSPGVKGLHTIQDALTILLSGTGLGFTPVGANTVAITLTGAASEAVAPATSTAGPVRDSGFTAEADRAPSAGDPAAENSDAPAFQRKALQLEQIVVTGSRLNQAARDSAVPVSVYTRKQIDASGTSTITDFLNTLPQVAVQTTTDGLQIASSGTKTVQLRGLPVGTTLILINGRRVESQSGFNSSGYFNLNNIPLAALERIEILPTGSSAVYGGDALGGVVNIILKQNFSGFEGSARVGTIGDGGSDNEQYSFAAGGSRPTGRCPS